MRTLAVPPRKRHHLHKEAADWVFHSFHTWRGDRKDLVILELGSLNINGGVRDFIQPYGRSYIGVDQEAGPGVDVVADAATYLEHNRYDVVVTTETLEHCPNWRDIIGCSYMNLKEGGIFIATMAGEGRFAHSAIDEAPIRDWEYYANVGAWELNRALKGFAKHEVNTLGTDLRCWAVR